MKNFNVILVSPLPPPVGGIASWTQSYLKYINENNIKCFHINSAVVGDRAVSGKLNYINEIKRLLKIKKQLIKLVKEEKNVVIHYNASCFTKGLIRDYIVLHGIKAPVLYQCHCNLDTNLKNDISKYLFKKIANIVDTVCVLNSDSLKTAKNYHDKVYYMPNFIDDTKIGEIKIRDKVKNICFVGRVEKRKGIDELLEASKQFPLITFNIIGPLEDECYNFSKYQNVKYLGFKENNEVMKILDNMDIYVLPSYSEGFPLGILEAMCHGLPIIASDVGSISDMIENKGGLLVEPKSSKDIVLAINKMLDKRVRKNMSEFNIGKVKNEYLIEIVLEKFFAIYRNMGR